MPSHMFCGGFHVAIQQINSKMALFVFRFLNVLFRLLHTYLKKGGKWLCCVEIQHKRTAVTDNQRWDGQVAGFSIGSQWSSSPPDICSWQLSFWSTFPLYFIAADHLSSPQISVTIMYKGLPALCYMWVCFQVEYNVFFK